MEKKRLGRGLDSLLGSETAPDSPVVAPLAMIADNPHQPRKNFDPDELASLVASVKSHGVLQPIVVRHAGDRYQLVAGERRLRAATEAGLKMVPIHVIDFNDQEAYEASLVENIHRSDLNPIEKAHGFADYMERFGLNQEQIAKRLGIPRSSITNLINLLELAPEVQDGIRLNQITEGHAKLLKSVKSKEQQVTVFKQIVAMGLSVKASEALIRDLKDEPAEEPEEKSAPKRVEKTEHVKGIETELQTKLLTHVVIKLRTKDQGTIVLNFDSNDDFERILEVLRK